LRSQSPTSTSQRVLQLNHFQEGLKRVSPSLSDKGELIKLLRDWGKEFGGGGGNTGWGRSTGWGFGSPTIHPILN